MMDRDDRIELLERELLRERRARIEAELLLEAKSSELYGVNQRLRKLYDQAADAIFVHDEEGKILDVNRRACEQLGYSRAELLELTIHDFVQSPDGKLQEYWRDLSADPPVHLDGVHLRRDGTKLPVEVRVAQIEKKAEPLYLAIARDVSVRHRQRELLVTSRERLRRLALEVTLTEAKERRRLAQVLHDTIGHDLTVARMHVKKLASENAEGPHANPAIRLIDGVVKQVRQVTFDLSPSTLFELGLPAAVEAVARVVSEEQSTMCCVQTDGDWRSVPMDLSILIFYVTRELIHNAVKHSEASQIDVSLGRGDAKLAIVVADDGKGFIPEKPDHDVPDETTFGLFSIRERLAGIGGELHIASEIEEGTRVEILVPFGDDDGGQGK